MMTQTLLYFLIGLMAALLAAMVVLLRKKIASGPQQGTEDLNRRLEELLSAKSSAEGRARALEEQLSALASETASKEILIQDLKSKVSRMEAEATSLVQKLNEQKEELAAMQERFRIEFKNLAGEILEEKTRKFTEQNQSGLEAILKPLGEKIREFEKKVEETYNKESNQRFSLEKEIKNLASLNQQISEDARNLTTALRYDSKKQGNWGELVLEKVLESSGLVKGQEYIREFVTKSGEGDVYRPDVVVNLPDNKHIIIDAKVSLVAYNDFVNAESPEERDKALRLHLLSLRNHVKMLSEKNYPGLAGFDTPDYVLLFVPIESSFSVAIQNDVELFHFAWERNVVIVSPTTLLATLRTVAAIWKHEKQELNVQEIAKKSGELYDKFVSFLDDLSDVGRKLESTRQSFDGAMNKLSTGKGNLVRRVEIIRELGAKSSKEIPKNLLDKADE